MQGIGIAWLLVGLRIFFRRQVIGIKTQSLACKVGQQAQGFGSRLDTLTG